MNAETKDRPDSEMLVYWIVLERGPIRLREVQRLVGFGSPSTAVYHLERLERAGLVCKDQEGKYCTAKFQKRGILRSYVLLGRRLLPKSIVYAASLSLAEIIVLFISDFNTQMLLALTPASMATVIFWYETYDLILYKRRLFKRMH